ncbi:MAG TPA: 2Fe-2S iron-sulfur cluster binding domain-containing protein [Pseudonocardiaceae bacterium]
MTTAPAPGASPADRDVTGQQAVHHVRVSGSDEVFDVPVGQRIHAAARRAGIWFPFECGWGSCGSCKATVVEGRTELLFPGAPAVEPRDERRRRVVLCQSTPCGDLVIRPRWVDHQPPPERPLRDYLGRLVDVEPLGPAIARFRFELTDNDGSPLVADYRPGQFAILETEPGLRRCLSLAGLPGGNRVEFIAKHYPNGPGSGRLFALSPGEIIPIELPYGDMWLRETENPVVLVAGGTGISAILAMVRDLAERSAGGPRVHVVYGATTREELVCWDELRLLTDAIANARLHGALLKPDESWTGQTGLVTDALEAVLAGYSGEPGAGNPVEVYLAGPPPMVRAVEELLARYAVLRDRVHVDSFG